MKLFGPTLILLTLISSFIFVSSVSSHGLGQSFPKEVGNYIVEFEYEVPEIVEGEVNSFVFRILEKNNEGSIDSGNPVNFDSVLVRFERKSDNSTYLVTRLVEDDLQEGISRLTANLNKGEYVIHLSFRKDEEKLAETSFDLEVKASDKKESPLIPVLSFMGGVMVGFIVCKRISR